MESKDITAENISRIAELFPNCITEALDEERSTPEYKVYNLYSRDSTLGYHCDKCRKAA